MDGLRQQVKVGKDDMACLCLMLRKKFHETHTISSALSVFGFKQLQLCAFLCALPLFVAKKSQQQGQP
jgi:hypothetical protein